MDALELVDESAAISDGARGGEAALGEGGELRSRKRFLQMDSHVALPERACAGTGGAGRSLARSCTATTRIRPAVNPRSSRKRDDGRRDSVSTVRASMAFVEPPLKASRLKEYEAAGRIERPAAILAASGRTGARPDPAIVTRSR